MKHDTVNPRQLMAVAFVAVLSPLIRRFPRSLAETAGAGAWLAVILTALPLALVLLALRLIYRKQPCGTGFADILCTVLGKIPGRALTGLYGLWFTAYTGFLLRSGAERFLSTVYPSAQAGLFIITMAMVCLIAAMGRLCTVARCAMLFRPLMAALFVVVFLLTSKDFDFGLLLPIDFSKLPDDGFAAVRAVNVLSSVAFLVFFTDRLSRPFHKRDAPWLRAGEILIVILLMTLSCLGAFGPALTAKMTYPFFMLARDVSVLGSLERAEPVVVALWVLSDFVMFSLLLLCAGKNLRFCFSCPEAIPDRIFDLRHGRWLTPVCAGAAAALALLLPGGLAAFRLLSDTIVPLANAGFSLGLPLLVLLIGLLRKRL